MSSNNNQNTTKKHNFCATELKITSEKFVWTVEKFSKRLEKCGECLKSSKFISTAPNGQLLKWQLEMYPNGIEEEFKDYISLFLLLIHPNNEVVNAKYEISLRYGGVESVITPFDDEYLEFYHGEIPTWGENKFIKREDLFNEDNGYLDGDRLTIVCKLVVQQDSIVEVPECRALEDFGHLFEKVYSRIAKSFRKMTKSIRFNKKHLIDHLDSVFKVHKCILGCRSPVFAAMFEHDMLEKNNNEINIDDMKGVVIEQMLRFIYSGKEPNLEDEEMAEDLLIGADKYELPRLKLLCERKLINSLEIANACRLLVLANRYSAKHLKAQAINFIKIHGNEVMESEDWKELADDPLKDQILKAFMAKQI